MSDPFKVVIAGGGVAGLTLANMLERFGIDYILLEAHGEIAPAVGASIGLLANGLRILDQIDLYEKIMQLPQLPLETSTQRDATGKLLLTVNNLDVHTRKRHGYSTIFFDRQWLLQTLYDKLQAKDRIILNAKVVAIDSSKGGVKVTTARGDEFVGSMVVGADGVHSRVRELMVRLANEKRPGYFPPGELDQIPCYYRCSFGIAHDVAGYPYATTTNVCAPDWSALVIAGPEERVYWFVFERLPVMERGKGITKYTKEDEEDFVKRFSNRYITDEITFGQIYAKKISSTLTPLHEFVLQKWHFDRIILVGDSVHKPNPISGQGGNGAMETAAELVNAVLRMRDARQGLTHLSDEDITQIFKETQAAREERERYFVAEAHSRQALSACENRLVSSFAWKFIDWLSDSEAAVDVFSKTVVDAARLQHLPVKPRTHIMPYTDELPVKPVSTASKFHLLAKGLSTISLISLVWFARNGSQTHGSFASLNSFLPPSSSLLVEGGNTLQLVYHAAQVVAPTLIYTIVGNSFGNRKALLGKPTGILAAMQTVGIAYVAPAHALINVLQGNTSLRDQKVPDNVGQALLPAFALGFIVPTALRLVSHQTGRYLDAANMLYRAAPVLVPALTSALAAVLHRRQRSQQAQRLDTNKGSGAKRENVGTSLFGLCVGTAAWSASTHWASLMVSGALRKGSVSGILAGMGAILGRDLTLASCAWLVGGLYSVWDLRRQGYIPTSTAVKAAVSTYLGQIIIGPGATLMALAGWQRKTLAELQANFTYDEVDADGVVEKSDK